MDNYSVIRSLTFPVVASALGWDINQFKHSKADFVGPCYIHDSKNNRSCFRYHETGKFHCFSCQAKGAGAIDIVKLAKRIGFQEAVAFLTPLATSAPSMKNNAPASVSEVTDGQLKPYTGSYEKYQVACPWLEERIPDAAVRKLYGVFCYNNPARKSAYSGRVMLPVKDVEGILYGYLGRAISRHQLLQLAGSPSTPEPEPKYLFPRNLPKSRFLFGADVLTAGKFGSVPLKRIWIVESPFCVLKYASLGLPAVSPYGWSVSAEQLELLVHLAKGIVYLPDTNKCQESVPVAGFLANQLWVKRPPLPAGIDDPEYLTKEQILAV